MDEVCRPVFPSPIPIHGPYRGFAEVERITPKVADCTRSRDEGQAGDVP